MSSAGVEEPPTGLGLATLDTEVRFSVEMAGSHSTADVASIVQAIDDLAVGAVWGALASGSSDDINAPGSSVMHALRQATAEAYERSRVAEYDMVASTMIESALSGRGFETTTPDNWTLTTASATNQWLKRELAQQDDALYEEVFSFATVAHAEHSSPLLIVIVIAPVVGVGGAGWAAAKGIKWVYKVRKERAAARKEEAAARIERTKADLVQQAAKELKRGPYAHGKGARHAYRPAPPRGRYAHLTPEDRAHRSSGRDRVESRSAAKSGDFNVEPARISADQRSPLVPILAGHVDIVVVVWKCLEHLLCEHRGVVHPCGRHEILQLHRK